MNEDIESVQDDSTSSGLVGEESVEETTPGSDVAPAASDGEPEVEPPSTEEVASTATEFVDGLLKSMGLEAEVTSSIEDETAFVDVAGENLGVLIGRRGQTLDAL